MHSICLNFPTKLIKNTASQNGFKTCQIFIRQKKISKITVPFPRKQPPYTVINPKTNYLPQISFATEMNCSVRRSRSFSTSSLQVDMSNDVF